MMWKKKNQTLQERIEAYRKELALCAKAAIRDTPKQQPNGIKRG